MMERAYLAAFAVLLARYSGPDDIERYRDYRREGDVSQATAACL
jgi:hypothetical protein